MGKKVSILARELGVNLKNEHEYDLNIVIDEFGMFNSELARIVEWLANRKARMERLDIYAHGLYVPIIPPGKSYAIVERIVGAYGVKVGQEFLTSANVDILSILNGAFESQGIINFHACGIAGMHEDYEGKRHIYSGDGIKLCKRIAKQTDCLVRASSSIQKYTATSNMATDFLDLWWPTKGDTGDFDLEFLPWSPPTWLFDPKGQAVKES